MRVLIKNLSLTTRLTIAYTLTSTSLVLIASGYLYWSFAQAREMRDWKFFTYRVEIIRSLLQTPDGLVNLRHKVEKEWPEQTSDMYAVRILDERGGVVMQSPTREYIYGQFPNPSRHPPNELDAGLLEKKTFNGMFLHARSIYLTKTPAYLVQIVRDRTEETLMLKDYRDRLFIVLPICSVICALLCYEVARRGLRPIPRMAELAAKITSTNLDERITSHEMPSELAHLAVTFDAMLDRLQASFERLQRFSADISHELRTPINNISGELQVALGKVRPVEFYQEAIGSALEECSRLSRIIDSLLFLAHADNPRMQLSKETVSLRKELEAVLEFYEPAATEKGILCTLEVADDILISVERTLFQRAVGNIISNALKQTPIGGELQIVAKPVDSTVEIVFRDTGSGIAEEHLPFVFDRFYRVDAARSSDIGGSGLGLAIVKSIAAIHGGDVKIKSRLGAGTSVFLSFPATC